MTVTVRRVEELADPFDVRRDVFVDEQDVPESIEMDGRDEAALQFVAYDDGDPVGTARLREPEPGVGKVERVAVREPRRGEGIGRRLMAAVEAAAAERGHDELHLHAQVAVEGFYLDLSYETVSDEFEEADIPHVEMHKEL